MPSIPFVAGDKNGSDGGGDDDDDDNTNGLPANANVVYFYYDAEIFSYENMYAYSKSTTQEGTYEKYGYLNWQTEIAQKYVPYEGTWETWELEGTSLT